MLGGGLLQRYLLSPVAANAHVATGMARPYAAMLLESREGEAAAIPLDAFRSGLTPTDADLQRYYSANRNHYMVPEQRSLRIARIGPDQVQNAAASDQEIAAYYNAHKADYKSKETRDISQALVQDQATAGAIAARAKGGATMPPLPHHRARTPRSARSRTKLAMQYAGVAGAQAAASVFEAPSGAVVGPVRRTLGGQSQRSIR